jgi:hypothetical protein
MAKYRSTEKQLSFEFQAAIARRDFGLFTYLLAVNDTSKQQDALNLNGINYDSMKRRV